MMLDSLLPTPRRSLDWRWSLKFTLRTLLWIPQNGKNNLKKNHLGNCPNPTDFTKATPESSSSSWSCCTWGKNYGFGELMPQIMRGNIWQYTNSKGFKSEFFNNKIVSESEHSMLFWSEVLYFTTQMRCLIQSALSALQLVPLKPFATHAHSNPQQLKFLGDPKNLDQSDALHHHLATRKGYHF